jgi:endonuclease YncB( thermonuclease family)
MVTYGIGERARREISMHVLGRIAGATVLGLCLVPLVMGQEPPAGGAPGAQGERPQAKPQPRPSGQRVKVDPSMVAVEDGDTVSIRWTGGDTEVVRILGIDTPETRRLEHNLPFDQPFGKEADAFAKGAFAAASEVELLRSPAMDPYDRTLGYLYINGRNFSIMVIKARYSAETVSHYGDNGLPAEAALVKAAARDIGPLPFEPPHQFRARMRDLTNWMKQTGQYPTN